MVNGFPEGGGGGTVPLCVRVRVRVRVCVCVCDASNQVTRMPEISAGEGQGCQIGPDFPTQPGTPGCSALQKSGGIWQHRCVCVCVCVCACACVRSSKVVLCALTGRVARLCGEIRPNLATLLTGNGIRDGIPKPCLLLLLRPDWLRPSRLICITSPWKRSTRGGDFDWG